MVDGIADSMAMTAIGMVRPTITVHTVLHTGMPYSSMATRMSQVTVTTSLCHGLISSVTVGWVR
jgi:hypothetical protein